MSQHLVDSLLESYRGAIGPHFEKYRNHVHRVFANCMLLDSEKDHVEKYAIAAVFHDLGIWTNNTIDYIDPSVKQTSAYLMATDRRDWVEEIALMIGWHHKINTYRGSYSTTVENFRRADWIDVTLGLLSFGMNRRRIKAIRVELPNCGFHLFLLKRIALNALTHPLNPVPMFRL